MTKHQINKYSFLLILFTLWVQGLISAVSNDAENVHEEVDDVQVEVEGGEHVLLGAERVLVAAPHHQLSVVDDVEAEDDAADARIHKVQSPKNKLPLRIHNFTFMYAFDLSD